MSLLTVRHSTVYRYREPVGLGEHRMMFRPRASHDLRLIETRLVITPRPAQLRWLHDSFDNSVAIATFDEPTAVPQLREYRRPGALRVDAARLPARRASPYYPFHYSDEDFPNLVRALAPHYPDEAFGSGRCGFSTGRIRPTRWRCFER